MGQLIHLATISPSTIIPLGIKLFVYDLTHLAYMPWDNCATCNNISLNNFPTRNQTHDLDSDTGY